MPPDLAQNAIFLLFGVTVFLLVEAGYLAISKRTSYVRKVNTRLKLQARSDDQHDVLVQLRRARGLTEGGSYRLPLIWFNRLVLQSGSGIGLARLGVLMAMAAVAGFGATVFTGYGWPLALLAALLCGIGLPIMVLRHLRKRRRNKFEEQLPESIDIMVRGLKAGHPLPVAIAMVAREMEDPIGTEFGLTCDELTYGLDLDVALNQMSARVGQDDFALVVTAICIQAKTGGNLSELLGNLSKVLRARFKMRRRIVAITAEGRMSAIGLSLLPFLVFGSLLLFAPNFYGELWDDPKIHYGLGGAGALMMVGNIIMYRMVNFKL